MALIDVSYWTLSAACLAFAFLAKYWIGFGFVHAALLLILLYLAVVRIPLMLNWSSNLYGAVFTRIFFFQVFAIATYAICYVVSTDDAFSSEFDSIWDAVYFSATTWTTLGYGDISPLGGMRLLTSLQALTGLSTLPVMASVIWLYCERRLWKKTQEEKDIQGYKLTTDSALGFFVEIESDRTREEQKRRDRIKLRPCTCDSSQPFIEKYFDIVGRLTPLPKFHVICKGCGAFSKSKLNAYLAAWAWNRGKYS
jgi:hypothetical protein